MTNDDIYILLDSALAYIMENIHDIAIVSQAFFIVFCGCILYYIFWGSRR